MEDLKINIDKLNKSVEDLPEVKRTAAGEIDLEAISTGKNEKGFYIVPDEIMESYYKELPDGTVNQSNTKRAMRGGTLKILSSEDREIQKAGGEALQAMLKQRRSIQETTKILLSQKASAEEIEQYNLPAGATKQDAMMAAMLLRAIERGDVQAGVFVRDTAGEKPTEKINAEVTALTPEDREMLERVSKRLETE